MYENRQGGPALRDQDAHIRDLLDRVESKLGELKAIVQSLTTNIKTTKVPIFKAHAWRKNQPRLQVIQEGIKNVKCSLNIMLGASNSQDMMRIRVDLAEISRLSTKSAQMEENLQTSLVRHHDNFAKSLAHVYRQVDQRIGNVEELLEQQTLQLQASQANQLGTVYGRRPSYTRPPIVSRQSTQHNTENKSSETIGVRVTQHAPCVQACPCKCHIQQRTSTPGLVDGVFGQVFVGYAGLPILSGKCDSRICETTQAAQVNVEYWFPLGFVWSKIIRLQLNYQPNIGPRFELSTLRRVPDSAQCVNVAMTGNIDGLKDLFKRGLASPQDVSTMRG